MREGRALGDELRGCLAAGAVQETGVTTSVPVRGHAAYLEPPLLQVGFEKQN